MAYVFGKKWTRGELMSFLSDPQQIASAKPFIYSDGKADGVRGININTGGGLEFVVLPGRGMDIPEVKFGGNMLNFLTGTGITSPAYYEEPGLGWLRSFYGGLLTTCGITNSGAPSVDNGVPYGIHGRIANAGAEDVCIEQGWSGDEYTIKVKGKMREVSAMYENMTMTRTFETSLGSKKFTMTDVIENNGYTPEPLLMLYHFNYGFPLLAPGAKIIGPFIKSEARDDQAAKDNGVKECFEFPEPVDGYLEKVFFHETATYPDGSTFVALLNRNAVEGKPLGIVMRFNKKEVPTLTEWKMVRKGFYVLGLEPGTAVPFGRGALREMNNLPVLDGQKTHTIKIDFEVLNTIAEFDEIEKEAGKLKK
jgi:hypothetical protein